MQNLNIYKKRIKQFVDRVYEGRYSDSVPFDVSYIYDSKKPIPYKEVRNASFKPIKVGARWGTLWGCSWFRFEARIPGTHAGKELVALIDIDGEGCVFVGGEPDRGLTNAWVNDSPHMKRRVPISKSALKNQKVSILVEGAANELFGRGNRARGDNFFLNQAELAVFHRDYWDLALDMQILYNLAEALPEDSPRSKKIFYGLNQAANIWQDGTGLDACKKITSKLLGVRANDSEMTAWSVGHAHIDLGWLWPIRETKRKGGRTFSTALRLMEEYPEYTFGASQPQLYSWVKEEYPRLYDQVKKRVKEGRWECQGAMWVEPDMNITGGESLVRQCLYGKAFFKREFDEEIRNLWLPDVFGYSAALPQILKKCGVDIFMTQKISWNETNIFPHHTFYWEGIDGTSILTHFLPTNNYNLNNEPGQLIEAQKRFAQADVQDDFLNLHGTGDGGGGPSRRHIEYGLRLRNTEGSLKFFFTKAQNFFHKIAKTPKADLPFWSGELYLELHRGTLTTQARMKRYNRLLERKLRDAEAISSFAGLFPKKELDQIWKDTLLNQFHDILPGSSITWVYEEAHEVSRLNLERLDTLIEKSTSKLLRRTLKAGTGSFVVLNTLSWERSEIVEIGHSGKGKVEVYDDQDRRLPSCQIASKVLARVQVPSMGYVSLETKSVKENEAIELNRASQVTRGDGKLENDLVRVRLGKEGTITSIFLKKSKIEMLDGEANMLLLWEDLPYSWDAWDISHYYRETQPEQAVLVERKNAEQTPLRCSIYQKLTIGGSIVEQKVSLDQGSALVKIDTTVDWRESGKLLKVHADTAIHSRKVVYEIQYGQLERPTHQNTSWDQARFEVPGQRYADISRGDFGLALINDCKYGYSAYLSTLELSLLRSPKMPDPEADMAVHYFCYGYFPHEGGLNESKVFEAAHELNTPLSIFEVESPPVKLSRSFFRVDGIGVKIEVVKPAEVGAGTVLRLYETRGSGAKVVLESEKPWNEVWLTDMLENRLTRKAGEGERLSLGFDPFEIVTLLIV